MLENCQNAQERWGGVHQVIDRWLQERNELVQVFAALQVAAQTPKVNSLEIERLCELLVDYASAGHFEVYEQLMREAHALGDTRGLELAKQIYPRLEAITEALLAFNDRCENGDCREGAGLPGELRQLGVLLLERFELEDCLIEVLHNTHQAPSQAATLQ